MIILYDTTWQLTQQNYNHTIPNKGCQVIVSPASTFEGLRYREIDMVDSYNQKRVESLKIKRDTLQSSILFILAKKVNYHFNFSQKFMLTGNH
mgnify:CR=1 FL=1